MKRIKLADEDVRTGLFFREQTVAMQMKLQMVYDMEQGYMGKMFEKYGVNPQEYRLEDWINGFEEIEHDEAN